MSYSPFSHYQFMNHIPIEVHQLPSRIRAHQEKIGLRGMGMKKSEVPEPNNPFTLSEDLDPELGFAPPDYGPPRTDFWHDPSDPSLGLTEKFCVVRVDSPNSFWVQNLGQKEEFLALEKEMTQWYNNLWEGYPQGLEYRDIIRGGFYAAYLDDYKVWVRVRIEELVANEDEFAIYLLDYGYLRLIPLDCLMFLRHAYNELPIQAVEMTMYDEGEPDFTSDEIKLFNKAVGGKEIYVIPLYCTEVDDVVYKTLRVILMTRHVASEMEEFRHSDFYNLNGRIKVDGLIRVIRDYQKTKRNAINSN